MTALSLYEIIVGEGGISPDYFLHRMEWWEIRHFLRGLQRRYRTLWEQARWQNFVHCKILGASIEEQQDLAVFPWERTPEQEAEDERHLQELIEQCKRENEQLSKSTNQRINE